MVASGFLSFGSIYADRFVVTGFLNLSLLEMYNFALLASTIASFVATPFNNILMAKFF